MKFKLVEDIILEDTNARGKGIIIDILDKVYFHQTGKHFKKNDKNYILHHIDGNNNNDNLDNLAYMSSKAHKNLHNEMNKQGISILWKNEEDGSINTRKDLKVKSPNGKIPRSNKIKGVSQRELINPFKDWVEDWNNKNLNDEVIILIDLF